MTFDEANEKAIAAARHCWGLDLTPFERKRAQGHWMPELLRGIEERDAEIARLREELAAVKADRDILKTGMDSVARILGCGAWHVVEEVADSAESACKRRDDYLGSLNLILDALAEFGIDGDEHGGPHAADCIRKMGKELAAMRQEHAGQKLRNFDLEVQLRATSHDAAVRVATEAVEIAQEASDNHEETWKVLAKMKVLHTRTLAAAKQPEPAPAEAVTMRPIGSAPLCSDCGKAAVYGTWRWTCQPCNEQPEPAPDRITGPLIQVKGVTNQPATGGDGEALRKVREWALMIRDTAVQRRIAACVGHIADWPTARMVAEEVLRLTQRDDVVAAARGVLAAPQPEAKPAGEQRCPAYVLAAMGMSAQCRLQDGHDGKHLPGPDPQPDPWILRIDREQWSLARGVEIRADEALRRLGKDPADYGVWQRGGDGGHDCLLAGWWNLSEFSSYFTAPRIINNSVESTPQPEQPSAAPSGEAGEDGTAVLRDFVDNIKQWRGLDRSTMNVLYELARAEIARRAVAKGGK